MRVLQPLFGALLLSAGFTVWALPAAGQAPVVGSWELWSVDGHAPEDARPIRTERLPLLWIEDSMINSVIEVLPQHDFRETKVQTSTWFVSVGRGGLQGDAEVMQEERGPATTRIVGHWRAEGDSLAFSVTWQQLQGLAAADLTRVVGNALPADSIWRLAYRVVRPEAEAGQDIDRLRGVVDGDRLTLIDANGRIRVYRRRPR